MNVHSRPFTSEQRHTLSEFPSETPAPRSSSGDAEEDAHFRLTCLDVCELYASSKKKSTTFMKGFIKRFEVMPNEFRSRLVKANRAFHKLRCRYNSCKEAEKSLRRTRLLFFLNSDFFGPWYFESLSSVFPIASVPEALPSSQDEEALSVQEEDAYCDMSQDRLLFPTSE